MLVMLSEYPRFQWAVIIILNVIALLYYFELIFFPYRLIFVSGFELVMLSIFSDVIALTQRTKRDYPLTCWLTAFFIPLPTLLYLYLFPFEKNRPQPLQLKYDILFMGACAFYFIAAGLFAYWR